MAAAPVTNRSAAHISSAKPARMATISESMTDGRAGLGVIVSNHPVIDKKKNISIC
jgi:alkanesulfonate monooxygenase SsuD/methylene tetrahydromethanopterin reductase-like flavin-dependent oxidoreductase (luciferase family)